MRLIMIAPTCDGTDVGEAWVAFQWVSRLAVRHDLTLLTYHKRGRPTAREQLDGSGARVIEWAEMPLVRSAERLNSMLKPSYVPFYWRARRWIRHALARGEAFDIVHQTAPVAMRYPSPAAKLGIPLIIGPVGGSLNSPRSFRDQENDTTPWFVALRKVDRFRLHHDPLLKRTYESADCVIGIAPYVAEELRALRVRRLEYLGDTGLDRLPPTIDRSGRIGPVRLLYVGRVVRTKGLRDLVTALQHIRDVPFHLDVVGEGPDRTMCEKLVAAFGLQDVVTFHGRIPHNDVWQFYARADIFAFPSYREPGGSVVYEAMGASLPLIVCNRGGPAASVDDTCGIRLPVTTPAQLARDLAAAIRTMATNPELRLQMGAASRDRLLRVGLWASKIAWAEDLYTDLTARKEIG